jgi:cobalamin synthase
MSAREFGGMSGDLAGYCITITAIVLLLGLVLAERITTLWF